MDAREQEIARVKEIVLKDVLGTLLRLADPESNQVDIDPEIRKAVAPYLHTWAIDPLTQVLLEKNLGEWQHATASLGTAERHLEETRALWER